MLVFPKARNGTIIFNQLYSYDCLTIFLQVKEKRNRQQQGIKDNDEQNNSGCDTNICDNDGKHSADRSVYLEPLLQLIDE